MAPSRTLLADESANVMENVKHSAKLGTLHSEIFDVLYKSLHNAPFSFCLTGLSDDIQNNYTLVRPRDDSLQLNLTAPRPQRDRGKYNRCLPSIVRPTASGGAARWAQKRGLCLFSV